jgi:hypothetical protein
MQKKLDTVSTNIRTIDIHGIQKVLYCLFLTALHPILLPPRKYFIIIALSPTVFERCGIGL